MRCQPIWRPENPLKGQLLRQRSARWLRPPFSEDRLFPDKHQPAPGVRRSSIGRDSATRRRELCPGDCLQSRIPSDLAQMRAALELRAKSAQLQKPQDCVAMGKSRAGRRRSTHRKKFWEPSNSERTRRPRIADTPNVFSKEIHENPACSSLMSFQSPSRVVTRLVRYPAVRLGNHKSAK